MVSVLSKNEVWQPLTLAVLFLTVLQLVKSVYRFVYVLDNIDWEEKAHDRRQDVQNRSVHAVATSIVFNRVEDTDLPDSGPQKNLHNCNIDDLVIVYNTYTYINQLTPLGAFQWPITSSVMLIGLLLT